jgi:hypothetical protein
MYIASLRLLLANYSFYQHFLVMQELREAGSRIKCTINGSIYAADSSNAVPRCIMCLLLLANCDKTCVISCFLLSSVDVPFSNFYFGIRPHLPP